MAVHRVVEPVMYEPSIEVVLHGIDPRRISSVTVDFNDGRASETHYTYNDDGSIKESATSFSGEDQIPGQMSLSDFIDIYQ